MSYLCIPIFVATVEQAYGDVLAAIEAGAEMVELRIDTLIDSNELPSLQSVRDQLHAAGIPWILTCRPNSEGGHFNDSIGNRLQTIQIALGLQPDYLDLELASHPAMGKNFLEGNAKLILSSHDFQGRPARLHNLLLEMDEIGCDVKKVVWTARTVRDNLEAFEILRQASKPTIAICMGEAGAISRILAKKFGAFLSFASLNSDAATAPGQVSVTEMKSLYRWDKVDRDTKVYGVVAHPVGHSMSPAIHNAAFDVMKFDGVYVPLVVNPGYESFKAFMETFVPFEGLDLSGLSVTLPHKENALQYLQEKGGEVEELAARIGAVNTIIIDRSSGEPKLNGINTDYAAILNSITLASGLERKGLAGMRVAVLGAGGTGRTATAALAHYGAKVVVYNRTESKARALAEEFGATAEPWEKLSEGDHQVYVNATSVGMYPRVEESPFGEHPPRVTQNTVVFDTIYNPMKTRLIQEAEAAGAKTIGGVEMFVQQAAAQFTAWTNQPAPMDAMRHVIERRLTPKSD